MKLPLFSLCLFLCTSCTAVDHQNPRENYLSPSPLSDALQQSLETGVTTRKASGASASLYISDRCFWTGTSGETRSTPKAPIGPNMLFAFGSITKTFVATIVLQLVEEGRLSLDDAVGNWIEHPNINPDITVRQLLDHGSGLYNYTDDAFWKSVDAYPNRVWAPSELLFFIKAPPNVGFASPKYSNTNYLLLGMIIEKVTGSPFEKELQSRVIEPFGLRNTRLVTKQFQSENWADRQYLPNAMYSGFWTAGAIASTAQDIAKWGHLFYSGNLISKSIAEEMFNAQPRRGLWGEGQEIGLGVFKERVGEFVVWGHNGWALPYVSASFYVPELNLSVAYSVIDPDRSEPDVLYQSLVRTYIQHQQGKASLCTK